MMLTHSASLMFLVIIIGIMLYMVRAIKKGMVFELRSIAALDAIPEAAGRAAEMGGKVLFCNGTGNLTSTGAAETIAGLSVLSKVSESCSEAGAGLVVPLIRPEVMLPAEEAIKLGLVEAGGSELISPDIVRYVSSNQWGLTSAIMGISKRENVVSGVLVGAFGGEGGVIASILAGTEKGAFLIGGVGRNSTQMPWFVAFCDYAFIGEEVFAAGAYISKDPVEIGTLGGQDISKIICIGLMLLGIIFYIFNTKILFNILM